jgi:hypothetical protein
MKGQKRSECRGLSNPRKGVLVMTNVTYSTLNAVGYTEAVGEAPSLIRESTARELKKLQRRGELGELAERSRLYKAIRHCMSRGYIPVPHKSTIRRVLLQSVEGLEAFANIKGEAVIRGRVEERFLNG